MSDALPSFDDVLAAAARIAPHARVTPVLRSRGLDTLAGCTLAFKGEHLQHTGAFKFRGACNAVWSLPDALAARGVVTHSSGNHGGALALAAAIRGIPCHVVVPADAVRAKLAAIANRGAVLHRCASGITAREATCESVRAASGATLVHPYSDPRVIAGQGTAALELLAEAGRLDIVMTPVGGGGLVCGTALAARGHDPRVQVFGAEPEGAADAFESLRQHRRITDIVPDTVCDGLRGTIGPINLALLQAHRVQVLLVSDDQTLAAMRLAWERLKVIIEPSCATVLAAVLRYPGHFAGRRVGLILSGGNVDLAALPWQLPPRTA